MIDLYSFRNWLLRLLAGSNSVLLNVNVFARIDLRGDKPFQHNVTMNQVPPAGTVGSQFPPPPPAGV